MAPLMTLLSLSAAFSSLASSRTIVSQPNGPLGVSLVNMQLVDSSRRDPYSNASERVLPISIISPIGPSASCDQVVQPYMDDTTASYWEKAFTSLYDLSISLNVDIPGQDNIVTYADGSVQYGNSNIVTDAQLTSAVGVRVQDLDFVFKSLSLPSKDLAVGNYLNLATSSAGIFGHSLGGAAALSAIINDKRFLGGADFDGGFDGSPSTVQTNKPFLIFASADHNQSNVPSWPIVWQNLDGWKLQLQLNNSAHGTFFDLPILVELYGIDNIPGAMQGLASVLGTINGTKAMDSIVRVTRAFFQFIFSHGKIDGRSVIDVAKGLEDIIISNGTGV
ncbi:hypothetical protein LTR10_023592 [Elasticomyces elasticus]|uniref:1-alkyl-2-acetylglycerophosphocholine esterase n=1 Tax=Exophiala sideris TaxID=1016849 RepID=A0ABR0JIU2_9EURO|nr:hypothetical protein LTR10_023592 [Elasticomyces elasticus]KAK5033389.1 hypothetical protein LTS07_003691 [Exophiala sideris]KAK5042116.1 hypothetical protein LTR13_001922 [Exophiala sideris]KAK5063933.1 hypothetical protein LTR69_003699 [Exophiala sideris]KAK5185384.1 hypothetical protein LTR44_002373 [Eurotiomycetes sp. CCFEE 6388]